MKEKRYFCDWFWSEKTQKKFTIVMLVKLILWTFVCYNVFVITNKNEINAYPESEYQYLDEISNNVIQQGVGINLGNLPDSVQKYEVTGENDEVIFKCYLNGKDMKFSEPPSITVKLSDNYDIISKERNYTSKDNFVVNVKCQILLCSTMFTLIFLLGICLFLITLALISRERKRKESSN